MIYSTTTDPRAVDRPFQPLVHSAMAGAWTINNRHSMAYIFDAVNPARIFKRGMRYDDSLDFPQVDERSHGDMTETDSESPGWMPYMPRPHS
jgi:hypothetical protein